MAVVKADSQTGRIPALELEVIGTRGIRHQKRCAPIVFGICCTSHCYFPELGRFLGRLMLVQMDTEMEIGSIDLE